MSFLTPFMLWGALAASIPVAIHFFFRSRYRTVPWAAMKFLLTSVEQTSRRLKFQELLLLLLRVSVLLMLAFAFARPFSSMMRGTGRGDSVDAVFVLDVSYSLGAKDGTKTRLERAKEEAIKIIDELPAHSTVQIVTSAGSNKTLVGPRSPANLDQAKQLLQDLDITSLTTNLAPGVAEAKEVFAHGHSANKELYVFSDMQTNGFDPQASEFKQTLQQFNEEKTLVHLVRCGTRSLKNVAIVGITPPTAGIPRPNQPAIYAVLVRNTGADEIENVDVSLTVDGDEKNLKMAKIAKLAGRQTAAVPLQATADSAGLHVLTAKILSDDLEGDNRFDQVMLVRTQVNILVVDGKPSPGDPEQSSSYLLMEALLPQTLETDKKAFYLQPRVVPAREASPALLAKADLCILTNVALEAKAGKPANLLPDGFLEALDKFVRQGHGLIIYGGDNVDPDTYNKLLGKKFGLLPMPIKAAVKRSPKDINFLNRTSFKDAPAAYWPFKDNPKYESFDGVLVWQYLDVDETPSQAAKEENPHSVILRLDNGKPIVTAKKLDGGEILFIGTAADAPLSREQSLNAYTWPRTSLFVPFLHVTVNQLLRGQTQTYNLKAGETLTWFATDTSDNVYSLRHPDGKIVRLGAAQKIEGRLAVRATDLPRAGIYHIIARPRGSESVGMTEAVDAVKDGTPIAVIPDLRESDDLSTQSAGQIDEYLGFQPIHIVAGDSASLAAGTDRLNREWTVWALLAVLALVLAETALAWWSGRAW